MYFFDQILRSKSKEQLNERRAGAFRVDPRGGGRGAPRGGTLNFLPILASTRHLSPTKSAFEQKNLSKAVPF